VTIPISRKVRSGYFAETMHLFSRKGDGGLNIRRAMKGGKNVQGFLDDLCSDTVEVMHKIISPSFRSPLQSCICTIREFEIHAVRVLTRVRKG
jgi:hypothetical protein